MSANAPQFWLAVQVLDLVQAPHDGVAAEPHLPIASQLPFSTRFCNSLPMHWYWVLVLGQALPLGLNTPLAVSQQVPEVQPQVAL